MSTGIPSGPPQGPLTLAQSRLSRRLWEGLDRPWVTQTLVVIVGVLHVVAGVRMLVAEKASVFGLLFVPRDLDTLTQMGAMRGLRVSGGEEWRLVSCILLHGDGMHVLLNGVALFALGRLCEAVYGAPRFLWLFMVSGMCGSTLSWAGGNANSVGASGGIFGLLGAAIVFGFRYRAELPPREGELFRRRLLPWVVLNLVIGAIIPFIDNLGHVGGLLGGALLALLMGNRVVAGANGSKISRGLMGTLAAALLAVGLLGVIGAFSP